MNKTEIFEYLEDISKLRPGWDGYGAMSISEKIIFTAQTFISKVPEDIFPNNVFPTGDGNIEFTWHDEKDNFVALVSISEPNKGHLAIFFDDTVIGEYFIVEDFFSIASLKKLKEIFHGE